MCKHTYCAGLSLYEAQCSAGSCSMIYYYYVNLWLNVFFSLLGTLMRGCIDGSSGKRHFSDGLTNSNVNAYLKWEMSSKSSNASRISAYLHPFICLFLSMSVLSNIWNTFVSHLLSIMQLKSLFPVGHWTCQLNNLKKTCHSPAACPHFSSQWIRMLHLHVGFLMIMRLHVVGEQFLYCGAARAPWRNASLFNMCICNLHTCTLDNTHYWFVRF